jgi:hypothetical protein
MRATCCRQIRCLPGRKYTANSCITVSAKLLYRAITDSRAPDAAVANLVLSNLYADDIFHPMQDFDPCKNPSTDSCQINSKSFPCHNYLSAYI